MKYIAAFFAVAVAALAQSPASLANLIVNYTVTSATGGLPTGTFSSMFTATHDFTVNTSGAPLSDPISYTWTRTGANTGTLVETDGLATVTATLTFSSETSATFRTTRSNSTGVQVGTATFSRISQPPAVAPLVNISTRATLAAGQILNPGFVVGGSVPRRVLIRAIGPALGAFGVGNALAAPVLTVFSGQTQIGQAAGWGAELAAVFSAVGAFALPAGSRDAALVLTLAPGSYTAQIGGGAGEVLAEVYFVD